MIYEFQASLSCSFYLELLNSSICIFVWDSINGLLDKTIVSAIILSFLCMTIAFLAYNLRWVLLAVVTLITSLFYVYRLLLIIMLKYLPSLYGNYFIHLIGLKLGMAD